MRAVTLVVVVAAVQHTCVQLAHAKSLRPHSKEVTAFQSVESITRHLTCGHMTLLLTDGHQEVEAVKAPQGVTVFQVEGDNLTGNATPPQLETTVKEVRQLAEAWHCLVVVVVSDDSAFLAAFAHLSLRRHALRWSTRILVFTRLPLSHLGGLHGLLSTRNAMLLRVQSTTTNSQVGVFVWQPYSAPSSMPLRVATWTPHSRLTLASHVSLFPDKFFVCV
ncbi:uncharacterized protein LOC135113876 [Scylla paramamosain]|uniref:uncharacterized protein LOC135113876 n=1 Tax=Scylla paramamosain TaxID=85552 RepID=UPI0030836107